MTRILTWLDPANDPQGTGYNILQSLYAICAGGFWGMGFGQSSKNLVGCQNVIQTLFIL